MSGKRNETEIERKKIEDLFRHMLELYTMVPPWPWRRKNRKLTHRANYQKNA